ncbi:MAG: hypothetical protein JJLCMIEE_01395 [Acidimicrobiales bacterium]|nr:hypothetical protein [Acidimicrobiales bacterium]
MDYERPAIEDRKDLEGQLGGKGGGGHCRPGCGQS